MKIKDITAWIAGSSMTRMSAALICALTAGYLAGMSAGYSIARSYIHGERPVSLLFYRPARDISLIYARVNSHDEIDRLHGYYAMLDNNIADPSFLIERYGTETVPGIRRSIIWILGCAGDSDETYSFFSDIYSRSPEEIRREIERALKRMGEQRYRDFRKQHGIGTGSPD